MEKVARPCQRVRAGFGCSYWTGSLRRTNGDRPQRIDTCSADEAYPAPLRYHPRAIKSGPVELHAQESIMKPSTAIVVLLCFATFFTASPPARAADAQESDYQKFAEFLVGTWTVEAGGQTLTVRYEMSPTKRCVTAYASADGEPVMQTVEGYDAEKNCWKKIVFWAAGGHVIADTKLQTPAPVGGALAGLTLKGKTHDVDRSGQASDSEVTYRIVSQDRWEVDRDGGTVIYTRQKKKG
jgi:hypothetical protein